MTKEVRLSCSETRFNRWITFVCVWARYGVIPRWEMTTFCHQTATALSTRLILVYCVHQWVCVLLAVWTSTALEVQVTASNWSYGQRGFSLKKSVWREPLPESTLWHSHPVSHSPVGRWPRPHTKPAHTHTHQTSTQWTSALSAKKSHLLSFY